MNNKLNLFLATLLTTVSAQAAPDLVIEMMNSQPNPTPTETPTPTTTNKPKIESYVNTQLGMGYRINSGTFQSQSAMTQFMLNLYIQQRKGNSYNDNGSPLVLGYLKSNVNVFEKTKNQKDLGTSLGLKGEIFLGYGFNKDQNGVDFLIGGSANTNSNVHIATNLKNQHSSDVGLETGLNVKTNNVVATLTASVRVGGQSCRYIDENNRQIDLYTGHLGFAGIGRLLIGDGVSLNVLMVNYPKSMSSNETPSTSSKSTVEKTGQMSTATLFIKLGKKVSLTGDCTIQTMKTDVKQYNEAGQLTDVSLRRLNQKSFSIGILRTL